MTKPICQRTHGSSTIRRRVRTASSPNIFQVLSLKPDALVALAGLRRKFGQGESPLGKRKEELIYVTVSALNNSSHCTNSHAVALAEQAGSKIADLIKQGKWQQSDLTPDESAMLAFCQKAVLRKEKMKSHDIVKLRDAGFSDEEILEITLHTAYRLFQNHMADTLGVEDEPV